MAIAVDKQGLLEDFNVWGVSDSYGQRFIEKHKSIAGKVELSELAFNDSICLTDSAQWVSVLAAFWCRFYRETEYYAEKIQALGAIQSLYFVAGMLGLGNQLVMIRRWWLATYQLHAMESPNMQSPNNQGISTVH